MGLPVGEYRFPPAMIENPPALHCLIDTGVPFSERNFLHVTANNGKLMGSYCEF
jgi:hypothetical protein